MAKHVADVEYLYISSRIKALQKNMLTRDKLMRLITAKSDEDAIKLLCETGWDDFRSCDMLELESCIAAKQKETFELLYRYSPEGSVIDVFRLKYDYHNLKSLIKAQALGVDARPLLNSAAIIPPQKLEAILREKEYNELAPVMRDAVVEAIDLLSRTGDPQLCDLTLDRAMFAQMLESAQSTENEFLIGYVRLTIDLANLKTLVRAYRAQKGFDYLKRALADGGNVACDRMFVEVTPETLQALFTRPRIAVVAQVAAELTQSQKPLAALDMACDNALIDYVRSAQFVAFGAAHVIAYLVAVEAELLAVRIVIAGRAAKLDEEKIKERLRASYV